MLKTTRGALKTFACLLGMLLVVGAGIVRFDKQRAAARDKFTTATRAVELKPSIGPTVLAYQAAEKLLPSCLEGVRGGLRAAIQKQPTAAMTSAVQYLSTRIDETATRELITRQLAQALDQLEPGFLRAIITGDDRESGLSDEEIEAQLHKLEQLLYAASPRITALLLQ